MGNIDKQNITFYFSKVRELLSSEISCKLLRSHVLVCDGH